MADLRVDIKTTADVTGANQATDALKATSAAANSLAGTTADAAASINKAQDAINETSKQSEALSSTLADTARNADRAASAVAAVSNSTDTASVATGAAAANAAKLGASFSDVIKRGSPAHELLDGILQGSLRSSSGILGLTRALTGLSRGFAIGGIGLFTTALAGVAGVALLLAKNLGHTSDAAGESKKKFDEAKKSAEELGRTELAQLDASLKKVTESAERETRAFNELEAAKGKVANAELALRTAQIQNDPRLSNEQKITAELKLRADFRKAEDAREIAVAQQKVDAAKKEAAAANDNLIAPSAQLKSFDQETDRLKAIKEQRDQLKADIENTIRESSKPTAGNPTGLTGLATGAFSPEVQQAKERLSKLPEASDNDIKLSEERADSVRKALATAKETARVQDEALKEAENSLNLRKKTVEIDEKLNDQTTRITAVPEIAKARQTDREAKTQAAADQRNPQAEKLVPVLAELDVQIKALREEAATNHRSARDPVNEQLNAKADALESQRDSAQTQFDAFSRNPTKADIKKSDTAAAKKDAKDLKLDVKPVEDAETKKNDELLKLAQDNNAGLKGIADTITALPPPPKPDTAPVLSGLIEYNGKTIEAFKGVQQNFVEIGKTLRSQAQQIESLSRQIQQTSP